MSSHPVYASTSDLAAYVGQPIGQDDRLAVALVMASRWVDHRIGYNATDEEAPVDSTPIEAPVSLTVVPVRVEVRNATLVASARFLRSGDVPFSVAGGFGDLAIRVAADIPEAELHLLGVRQSFGVA